jgi:phage host-nuclease inhibitor protein Gam
MAKKRADGGVKLQVMGVETLETADGALRQIGELELAIGRLEADCKKAIGDYVASMQEEAAPLQEKIKLLRAALKKYCTKNKAAIFKDARSIKLAFGAMGWRENTKTKSGDDSIDLIRKVYGKVGEKFIRSELIESVIVAALTDLTDAELAAIHVTRETKDKFFAEPAVLEAKDYQAGEGK